MNSFKEYEIGWDLGKDVTYEILIANLGGYDEAKSKLRDNGSLHAERLKHALLQYRRQNNIFEVGDAVVEIKCDDETLDEIGIVDGFNYHGAMCVKFSKSLIMGGSVFFKHATKQEIEAGKRLDD